MGEHDTWLSLIPFVRDLEHSLAHSLGKSWLFGVEVHDVHQVTMGILVFIFTVGVALHFRDAIDKDETKGVIPESRFNLRSIVEVVTDYTYGIMVGLMGEKAARHFLPFIGTFAFFIMFSNLLGLIPGFLPPTDSLNTTVPCAVMVFFATHIYGLRQNGMKHITHMMGPVPALAPLIFPIEVISHIARPVSLALRLAGNMIGDHKAVGIFLKLTVFIIPVALLGLGFIVCLVQTMVFCLLSVVYIGMALEDMDHAEAH
jgi:F-type H+-transporting ATPase subunit a